MTETTTRDRRTILDAARRRIAEHRERAEALEARRRDLPAAICRTCGGEARAGTGTRGPDPMVDPAKKYDPTLATLATLDPIADHWRRTCEACAAADASGVLEAVAVSRIVGFPVAQSDARDVVGRMRRPDLRTGETILVFPTAQASGLWTGSPWGHVVAEDRDRVRAVLDDVVSATVPKRHVSGCCGLCGARRALEWWVGPSSLRWPSSEAQVHICDTCAEVWNRRGGPHDGDDLARIVVELATGLALPLGVRAPETVRPFAASAAADPEGLDEPWTFSEGVNELRRQVWTVRPWLAPEHLREQAEAWHREDETARAEAARAEAEAEKAAGW